MIFDLETLREKIFEEMSINSNLMSNNVQNILINYSGIDWKKYILLDENTYSKKKIYIEKKFDMYIITWNKYQESKIHDHSSNGCVYKVMKGNINEIIYNTNTFEKISEKCLKTNDISCISDNIGFHKMSNNYNEICISIHIYSPPEYKTNYY